MQSIAVCDFCKAETHGSVLRAWYGGVLLAGKENAFKRTPPHQATVRVCSPRLFPQYSAFPPVLRGF